MIERASGRIVRVMRCFPVQNGGGVAIMFALTLIPLLLMAGAGLDLARTYNQKEEIQGAVDAAALAGAGNYVSAATLATATAAATNYMAQFKTSSGLTALAYTVTPSTVTSNSSVSLYKMTVSATSTVSNTLMKMTKSANTVVATATAQNPVYNITLSASAFSSDAVDTNSISYYTVPSDNSVPTTTTAIYSNAAGSSYSSSYTVSLTASQSLGFMLTNTTDGNATTTCNTTYTHRNRKESCTTSNGYGSNSYGGASGSVHYFYSHLFPPSSIAYPSVTKNCSVQVTTTSSGETSGSCLSALSTYSTVNCVQASGKTLYFWWNDMGGTSDDYDFNDVEYQVSCALVDSSVAQGLVLTN